MRLKDTGFAAAKLLRCLGWGVKVEWARMGEMQKKIEYQKLTRQLSLFYH